LAPALMQSEFLCGSLRVFPLRFLCVKKEHDKSLNEIFKRREKRKENTRRGPQRIQILEMILLRKLLLTPYSLLLTPASSCDWNFIFSIPILT
jgi:hypothetical protein